MPASKKNHILFFFVFLTLPFLSCAFWYQSACAQPMLPAGTQVQNVYQGGSGLPVGKIQSVWGDVVIVHAGAEEAYRVKTGLPLYRRDTIITNRNAGLSCRLRDGSTFKLAADSKLKISLSAHDTQRRSSIASLYLIAGKAYFQIAKLDDFEPREFKVETDLFIAGGRQADFAILMLEEHTEIIAFKDSLLEVMSLEDPEQNIFLSEFERVVIQGGELPPAVEVLPVEQARRLLIDFQQHSDQRLSELMPDPTGEKDTGGDEETPEEAAERNTSKLEFP